MILKYCFRFLVLFCLGIGCTYDYLPEEALQENVPPFECEDLPSWADMWRIDPQYIIGQSVVLSDNSTFLYRLFVDNTNNDDLLCIYADSTFYANQYLEPFPQLLSVGHVNGLVKNSFYHPWPSLYVTHKNQNNKILACDLTRLFTFELGQSVLSKIFNATNNRLIQDAQFISDDTIIVNTVQHLTFIPMWYLINKNGVLLDSFPNFPGSSACIGFRPGTREMAIDCNRGLVLYDFGDKSDTGRVLYDNLEYPWALYSVWIDKDHIAITTHDQGLILRNVVNNTHTVLVSGCQQNGTNLLTYSEDLDMIFFSNMNIDTIASSNNTADTILVTSSICKIKPDGTNFSCTKVH